MKHHRALISLTLTLLLGLTACGSPGGNGALPRLGSLSRIAGSVQIRVGDTGDFSEAANASVWEVGGQLKTGAASSVHISLADGTLILVGSDTRLNNLSQPEQWLFGFEQGALWILLYGQRLTFTTPLGKASVFGTAIALKYNVADPVTPADDVWVIQCLRGACSFEDGTYSIKLEDLGLLVIRGDGTSPEQAQVSRTDVDDFIALIPEASGLLSSQRSAAPLPSDTPPFTSTPTPSAGPQTPTATPAPLISSTPAPTDTPLASPTRTRPPTLVATWTSRASQSTDTPAPPPTNPPPQPTNPPPPTNPPQPSDTPVPPTDTPVPSPTDTVEPSRTPVPTRTP